MTKRVLIVDDERDLSELLAYNLHRAGYEARVAHDGRGALSEAQSFKPDLIVLDVMMPEFSGIEVAQHLKRTAGLAQIPIIMLTARSEETDELTGLAAGADDYITKPFSMKVLEARIEAVLRRAQTAADAAATPAGEDEPVHFGPLSLDPGAHEVRLSGRPMKLTNTEYRLISSLMHAGGRVLSRQVLINRAMGPGVTVTERTIDVHVTSIRKKLAEHAGLVRTVRGVGYRLTLDESPDDGVRSLDDETDRAADAAEPRADATM